MIQSSAIHCSYHHHHHYYYYYYCYGDPLRCANRAPIGTDHSWRLPACRRLIPSHSSAAARAVTGLPAYKSDKGSPALLGPPASGLLCVLTRPQLDLWRLLPRCNQPLTEPNLRPSVVVPLLDPTIAFTARALGERHFT